MRNKTFLKAVCLFTCLSILMLSVPGAIAYERPVKKTYTRNLFMKSAIMFSSILSFLNLKANSEKSGTSPKTVSNVDSSQRIRITGGKLIGMLGDRN